VKKAYLFSMGYSVDNIRRVIKPIQELLGKMREVGFPIFHVREGHIPNMADCNPVKYWRSLNVSNTPLGARGSLGKVLVRGEPGWEIIDELRPIQDKEVIIDKPGKGAFYATELEAILRNRNIQNLILVGVTTDVGVYTTMREANDRGFDCLLVSDATAAADPEVHWATMKSVELSGGIFGATADSNALLDILDKLKSEEL